MPDAPARATSTRRGHGGDGGARRAAAECGAARRLGRPDARSRRRRDGGAGGGVHRGGRRRRSARRSCRSRRPGRLESVLESLLFASDRPLPVERSEAPGRRARRRARWPRRWRRCAPAASRRAAASMSSRSRAAGTCGRARTTQAWVSRLVAGKPQRLTRAMLETLSIVAYRQPITRPEIDDVRGVDCGPVLEDAARSRARAHDREEGRGRAADPLRDDAGVPAHLQPEGSGRAADAARVPRAERGRHGEGRRARRRWAPTTPRRQRARRPSRRPWSRASWIPRKTTSC